MNGTIDFRQLTSRVQPDGTVEYVDHKGVVLYRSVGRRGWFVTAGTARPAFQIRDGRIYYAAGFRGR